MSFINIENCELGWTQSEMATLNECGYKWFLQYNQLLRKKGTFSWSLVLGDAFHRSLEAWFLKGGGQEIEAADFIFEHDIVFTAQDEKDHDYHRALLVVMLLGYIIQYPNDPQVFKLEPNGIERVIVYKVRYRDTDLVLTGKIDLHGTFGFGSQKMVLDHKTCGRLSMVNVLGWDFRFQFMFYVWLLQQAEGKQACRGFVVNAVKKTELRIKKDESVQMFMSRVQADMKNRPEEYFYRKALEIKQGTMDNFENNVLKPRFEKLVMLQNPDIPEHFKAAIALDRNTDACFKYGTNAPCQFLPICQNGFELESMNYEQRTVKHTELAE